MAFTDRGWFAPLAEAIGADLEVRDGLVEASGRRGDQSVGVGTGGLPGAQPGLEQPEPDHLRHCLGL